MVIYSFAVFIYVQAGEVVNNTLQMKKFIRIISAKLLASILMCSRSEKEVPHKRQPFLS